MAIQAWGLFAQGAQWRADLTAAYLEFARLSGGRCTGHAARRRPGDDLAVPRRGADLRDANLQEVKLAEANLEDADLRGSKVRFGNFQGNMQGCRIAPRAGSEAPDSSDG